MWSVVSSSASTVIEPGRPASTTVTLVTRRCLSRGMVADMMAMPEPAARLQSAMLRSSRDGKRSPARVSHRSVSRASSTNVAVPRLAQGQNCHVMYKIHIFLG
jgi:hypothetical protein